MSRNMYSFQSPYIRLAQDVFRLRQGVGGVREDVDRAGTGWGRCQLTNTVF